MVISSDGGGEEIRRRPSQRTGRGGAQEEEITQAFTELGTNRHSQGVFAIRLASLQNRIEQNRIRFIDLFRATSVVTAAIVTQDRTVSVSCVLIVTTPNTRYDK